MTGPETDKVIIPALEREDWTSVNDTIFKNGRNLKYMCANSGSSLLFKKNASYGNVWFLALPLPLAMALIKTKRRHLFWPIGLEMPFFKAKLSQAIENSKFKCKMSVFRPIGQKDCNICFYQC